MIAIINTGCANINSVKFAFERLGAKVDVISDASLLKNYERAILPGVGHASVAMKRLVDGGWDQAIKAYQSPLLGICLGMQLLCEQSAEGDVKTLGVIPGKLQPLTSESLTLPHMGWNQLSMLQQHPMTVGIDAEDFVYFVHSFAHPINDFTIAQTDYAQTFSAMIAKDNYVGMQFHPERSAKIGAKLLLNFLNWQPTAGINK